MENFNYKKWFWETENWLSTFGLCNVCVFGSIARGDDTVDSILIYFIPWTGQNTSKIPVYCSTTVF